jgi:UDP-N-acetylmuramate dehydrogenase
MGAIIIEKSVPLAPLTTLKVGGRADYFCCVHSIDELKELFRFIHSRNLPFFILGGGSNIVVSDDGFRGLVIKPAFFGVKFESKSSETVEVSAAASEKFDTLIETCVSEGLYGLENLSGIPGSVGATPVQNIGAYGVEVGGVIAWVEAFDTKAMCTKIFTRKQCRFTYRNSFFKTKRGRQFVITKVVYKLSKQGLLNISYKDVEDYFKQYSVPPTLKSVRDAVLFIRSKKFPDLSKYGTAGSFFKNPILTNKQYGSLKKKFPDLPSYYVDGKYVKIPAGWLIDRVGKWRGIRWGSVGSCKNQALVLVNFGGARTKDILGIAEAIREDIYRKTKIKLEFEVELIGGNFLMD